MRLIDDELDDAPPQINIVPMIDVIFAILTFFIMSSMFLTKSEGLPINLPKASTSRRQPQTQIVVSLKPDGQVFLNQQPAQPSDLPTRIQMLMQGTGQNLVIIQADENTPHGRVVTVMDQVRTVPGAKLAIATQRP